MSAPGETSTAQEIHLTVNGEAMSVRAHPMERLLDILRHELGLNGVKEGCGEGEEDGEAVEEDREGVEEEAAAVGKGELEGYQTAQL